MHKFSFRMAELVEIKISGERGVVISRCENSYSENQYQLRMRTANGRTTEQWRSESALRAIPAAEVKEHE